MRSPNSNSGSVVQGQGSPKSKPADASAEFALEDESHAVATNIAMGRYSQQEGRWRFIPPRLARVTRQVPESRLRSTVQRRFRHTSIALPVPLHSTPSRRVPLLVASGLQPTASTASVSSRSLSVGAMA